MYKTIYDEPGCYIDGAMGIEHALDRISELLPGNTEKEKKLLKKIEIIDSTYEFLNEIFFEAAEILNEYTNDGLYFEWNSGDLILYK